MNKEYYLDIFQRSDAQLNLETMKKKQLESYVGVTLDSVVLKLNKKHWTNDIHDPVNANTRIFFAIWVNDKTLKHSKLFYNIHALKLRQLPGYAIASREFAESFRRSFKIFKKNWENVSINFGPLNLMEGWEYFETANLEDKIIKLATNFLTLEELIENALRKFKDASF